MNNLPAIGTIFEKVNDRGRKEYYKVVSYGWTPKYAYTHGETVMMCDEKNHDDCIMIQPCFKNGKNQKYEAHRCDYWQDFKVIE